AMSVLVMVSALGALNGLIFAGARVSSSLGADHRLFAWLGRWHPRRHTPVVALATQAAITLGMIAVVGTEGGRVLVDNSLKMLGLEADSWQGRGGFELLLRCTAPVFWLFFLLTGISLFVLRFKDRDIPRPFPVPLYPVLPLIFCANCAYMV